MSDSPELYGRQARPRPLLWVFGAGLAIAVVILVLASGGGSTKSDGAGDVRVARASSPRQQADVPIAAAVADIVGAEVSSRDSDLVFEITTAAPIPETPEQPTYELDITTAGTCRGYQPTTRQATSGARVPPFYRTQIGLSGSRGLSTLSGKRL